MAFCTKCGTQFEAGTAFCGNCGTAVAPTPSPGRELPGSQRSGREVPVSDAPAPSAFAAIPIGHEPPFKVQSPPKARRSYRLAPGLAGAIGVILVFAWHNRYSLPFFKFDPVQIVCQGEIDGHKGAIGQVFNTAFQNPRWSVLAAPDGGTEVQFDGAVQYGRSRAFLDTKATEAFLKDARLGCITSLRLNEPIAAVFKQAFELTHKYGIDADPDHMFQPNYFASINPDPEFLRQFEILRTETANYWAQISGCVDNQTLPVKVDFIFSRDKRSFFLADGPAFGSTPFSSFESLKSYLYQ